MKATRDNLFTDGLSGSTKNMTFTRRKSGKTIVAGRRGPSKVPPTAAQMEVRDKFKSGVIYAKAVMADAAKKELYSAAAQSDQSAYNLALRDAVKAPKVQSIAVDGYSGKLGEAIIVRAMDDFRVERVEVSIFDAAGALVESGKAVKQANELDWLYAATVANEPAAGFKVSATAFDLPGNRGSLEITV